MKFIFNFTTNDGEEVLVVKSNPIEAKSSNEAVIKLLLEDETIKAKEDIPFKITFLSVEEIK
jgi:hypothetical protein